MPLSSRRTLRIAPEILEAAADALGTRGVTETVNAALEEVVRAKLRRDLIETGFEDLTPEGVEERRRMRDFSLDRSSRQPAPRRQRR